MRVLPVAGEHIAYADEVADRFTDAGFRVVVDRKDSKLGAKIALGEIAKVSYIVVVGKAEAEAGDINLRPHGKRAFNCSLEKALRELVEERDARSLVGRFDGG